MVFFIDILNDRIICLKLVGTDVLVAVVIPLQGIIFDQSMHQSVRDVLCRLFGVPPSS